MKGKPIDVRSLIERTIEAQQAQTGQEFLAPLLDDSLARIRVGGVIHTLRVADATRGWWVCRMVDTRSAVKVEEAQPFERGEYLVQFPSLRLVLLERLTGGDWLAIPFNPADMQQRFRLQTPVLLRLVEGGQPFDRVIGRVEGQTVWYDDRDNRADTEVAEQLRAGLEADNPDPRSLARNLQLGERAAYQLRFTATAAARATQAEQAERERRQQASIAHRQAEIAAEAQREQTIRDQLIIAGARLIGYEVYGGEVLVTWERDGRCRTARVDTSGNVVSAGICLSGRDRVFDLASLVGVVEDSPTFARNYAPRGWGYDEGHDGDEW